MAGELIDGGRLADRIARLSVTAEQIAGQTGNKNDQQRWRAIDKSHLSIRVPDRLAIGETRVGENVIRDRQSTIQFAAQSAIGLAKNLGLLVDQRPQRTDHP